ncbi:helix-turn-helix domain-containing protein [Spiroplasma endosymbiont of Sarcophaga variegata]|uniref:helix-turn-helix domain-containing protein n=1 Tax=Spiroplasma endosymbiont of Sarcophaga variegata TaxID=3066304 RepID=UPI003AF65F1B
MLDYKDLEILELIKLWIDTQYKKVKDFLNDNKMSKGYFYYHLKHINNYLVTKNLMLDINNLQKYEFLQIYNVMVNETNVFITAKNQLIVFMILFVINKYTKISELRKIFEISVSSVFKNIAKLNHILREHHTDIVIRNKGEGYYLDGNLLTIRRLIVNLAVYINNNHKSKNLILNCMFSKLNLEYSEDAYDKICYILTKYYDQILIMDLDFNTYSLILYFLMLSIKNDRKDYNLEDNFIKNHSYFDLRSFQIATQIINELQETFEITFNNSQFEKSFLGMLMLNRYDILPEENSGDEETLQVKKVLSEMLDNMNNIGYSTDKQLALSDLLSHVLFFKQQWNYFLFDDASIVFKQNFINHKIEYQNLFKLCYDNLENIECCINKKLLPRNYLEFTLVLLSYVYTWPIVNQPAIQKAILVTNLQGNLINLLKEKAIEAFLSLAIIEIVPMLKFNENKEQYLDYLIISDNKDFLAVNAGIYFSLDMVEDNMAGLNLNNFIFNDFQTNSNIKLLIQKILDSKINKKHKIEALLQLTLKNDFKK